MVKPKKLKPGSKIGIVSPSYWLDKDDLEKSAKYFSNAGYRLKLGRSNYLQYGPFAGTAQERADDINEMFLNQEIDAIFAFLCITFDTASFGCNFCICNSYNKLHCVL